MVALAVVVRLWLRWLRGYAMVALAMGLGNGGAVYGAM